MRTQADFRQEPEIDLTAAVSHRDNKFVNKFTRGQGIEGTERGRLSFPFFFDPNFDAEVKPIFSSRPATDRWDGTDLQEISGSYGAYLLQKIAKVFPDLVRTL